jgi:ABC-type transport system involved in multi-copper enzyme maturation permease subunit
MFKILLKKEILENIKNYRFVIALLLTLMIIPTGFYINVKKSMADKQHYNETLRLYNDNHKVVQDVMSRGAATFRPPSDMNLLSNGVEHLLPTAIKTFGFIQNTGARTKFINNRTMDSPFAFLYGRLDMTYTGTVIMAVLAMFFSFNSITGEKESRSLAQIMSYSVSRSTIISAKMLANFLVLAMVFLVAVVVGILVILKTEFHHFFRFLLGILVSLIFIFTFLNLGLCISTLTKNTITSIVVLISCWIFFSMILPKGSVVLAKTIKPVKSREVIEMGKNQIRIQNRKELDEAVDGIVESSPELRDLTLNQFWNRLKDGNPAAQSYIDRQQELEDDFKEKLQTESDRIESHYQTQRNNQKALAKSIARLSPVSCFVHLMTELAGTGLLEYQRWLETESRFHQLLYDEIASKYEKGYRFRQFSRGGYSGDRNAPVVNLNPLPLRLGDIFKNVWIDFILLILYGILFFAAAYVIFLKYDVR